LSRFGNVWYIAGAVSTKGKGHAMNRVSWIVALVIGFAVGFVGRGAFDDVPTRSANRGAPTARPARPTEDPRAIYRVPVEDSPSRGPADALVTIVESSDFECPFCKRGAATMKELDAAYPGKLRFVFRHNPLPFHRNALPAATLAEEARAQGGDAKFWAVHDALFELAPALDAASLEAAAAKAGLDVEKVKAALASGAHRARIERDQKLVQSVGAPATPTFFVNGRKIAGAKPLDEFRKIVDEELRKAQALVASGTPAGGVYAKIMEGASTAPVFVPGAPGAVPPGAGAAGPSVETARPPPSAAPVFQKVPVRADDPARGPKDAKLTVVLFSDFQCPFCARVEPTLKGLEEAFPGQIRIVWKHQPLPMHNQAIPAALAAEAAREQGKFWPMHDRIFADQKTLSPEALEGWARDLGLDVKKFKAAVDGRRNADRIAQDQQLAGAVGANGTPTMFFNCRQVVGAQPLERLRGYAEEELKKVDALLAGAKPGADLYDRACQANLAAAAAAAPAPRATAIPAALGGAQAPTVRPDDPVKGNARAPVTVVLFSDFQCPFCARVGPTLEQVERAYGDKVRIVWKHQPLAFHPNALPAAEAAEAAREQGKFWPMHDKLFQNQRVLSDAVYAQAARELGLDLGKFEHARRSGRARARIEEDQKLAERIGARATPTMFVNGVKVEGAVPFEQLKAVIDGQLTAAR
jgi:protein-disulfide isomerase